MSVKYCRTAILLVDLEFKYKGFSRFTQKIYNRQNIKHGSPGYR